MLGEKKTSKYLGILGADTIKHVGMKEKIKTKYLRRTRKLVETKLLCRNLIKGINTWAFPLVRYSGQFLKKMREELQQMDQRTRKLITMNKALHRKDDVDRLYVSRKGGGRGLTSIEVSLDDASTRGLGDFIKNFKKERLITGTRKNTDNIKIKRTTIISK